MLVNVAPAPPISRSVAGMNRISSSVWSSLIRTTTFGCSCVAAVAADAAGPDAAAEHGEDRRRRGERYHCRRCPHFQKPPRPVPVNPPNTAPRTSSGRVGPAGSRSRPLARVDRLATATKQSEKTDPLAGFSERTRSWFERSFEAPTPAQEQGWPAIATGANTLICAPTGSGKTLTAFLWGIDSLAREKAERRTAGEEAPPACPWSTYRP